MRSKLSKHDWLITIIIFLLLGIGLLVIFSTTYNTTIVSEGAGSFPRQLIFIIAGLVIYFGLIHFDIEWIKQRLVLILIYIVILGLLLYVWLFGENIAGTQRWISIGFINIQPSEYSKIVVIIITSYILGYSIKIKERLINLKDKYIEQHQNIVTLILKNIEIRKVIFALIAVIPIIGLVFVQPSLGNALIILLIWFSIIVSFYPDLLYFLLIILTISQGLFKFLSISNVYESLNWRFLNEMSIDPLFLIAGVGLIIFGFLRLKLHRGLLIFSILIGLLIIPSFKVIWENVIADYQKERVEIFLEGPESDPYGSGYQVTQSTIALGSGRFWGRGYLQGSQSSLKVLDYAYTDFIFAALGEQFGFTGNIIVLAIYIILVLRILWISKNLHDPMYSFIALGVAAMILLNVFINTGMNMGILPVTGVPLPLISYGGSSVLVNMIGLGLVQSLFISIKSIDISEKVLV